MKDTKIRLNDKTTKMLEGDVLTMDGTLYLRGGGLSAVKPIAYESSILQQLEQDDLNVPSIEWVKAKMNTLPIPIVNDDEALEGLYVWSSYYTNARILEKQNIITGAATSITSSNLTASRALISDASGKVGVASVTSTQLGYLSGVTSSIQTQLNGKAASSHSHTELMSVEGGSDATIGRDVNRPTSDFSRKVMLEFKNRSAMGLGGTGTYAGLLTMAAYSDSSSGATHSQLGYNGDNLQYRSGTYGSAWNAWKTIAFQDWVNSNFSSSNHSHTFASITSKPTTLSGYGITDAAASSHTHTFASLTSRPTTLAGYGITDAATASHTHSYLPLSGGTIAGTVTNTSSIPHINKQAGAKSWVFHQSGSDFMLAPSATNDGTDWFWGRQFKFASDGHFTVNAATISSGLNVEGGIIMGGGISIKKDANGAATIYYPVNGGNDPGYIRHTETSNAAEFRFCVSDDTSGDYFRFGSESGGNFNTSFLIHTNGDATASGNLTAYSDAKLKTNIKPYESGLEKVMQLKPSVYDRIDIESDGEIGFIAQEVGAVEPNLVKENLDGEAITLSLDYSRMVVMLTAAMQTQQKQIEALTKRIEELENASSNI